MQENPYKTLREDFEFRDNGYKLTTKALATEFADKNKPYYCSTLTHVAIRKIETNQRNVSEHEMRAYCLRFNATADFLHGFTTVKYKNAENIEMVERITGLSNNAINTLIKLKSGKYYNQYKFDYALHTLNLILSTYENCNLFELIYHFLFGKYERFGHYDENGKMVYDGSHVYISDRYETNSMGIDSKLVSKASLLQITDQLEYWKQSLENKDYYYGKLLPSKEKIINQIKEEYESLEEIIKTHKREIELYEKHINETPNDYETLYRCSKGIVHTCNALEWRSRNIEEFNYTLKNLYNEEYHIEETDSYVEKEVERWL